MTPRKAGKGTKPPFWAPFRMSAFEKRTMLVFVRVAFSAVQSTLEATSCPNRLVAL